MPKTIPTPQPPIEDKKLLPASLRFIVKKLEERKEWKPTEVRRVVLEAGVKQEHLQPWANYGHPAADSYGATRSTATSGPRSSDSSAVSPGT